MQIRFKRDASPSNRVVLGTSTAGINSDLEQMGCISLGLCSFRNLQDWKRCRFGSNEMCGFRNLQDWNQFRFGSNGMHPI